MFERLQDMYTVSNLTAASTTRNQDCRLQKRYDLHLTKDFITAPEKFIDATYQCLSILDICSCVQGMALVLQESQKIKTD